MTDLGLISAMPVTALLMLALLTLSFAVTLTRQPVDSKVALIHVLVLVIALYGVTAFVEAEPRFGSVYRHVGIIDYLLGHGSVNPRIDAYFNWPGFFALGALVTKLAGWHNALAFAAWGPLVYNLLYLPPLLAIFSWASDDRRVRWLAVWVFFSCNWVGQDYISPQGTAFFLWLAMVALLLRRFCPSPGELASAASMRGALRAFGPRAMRSLSASRSAAPGRQTFSVLLVILVIYTAIVTGHQLTPVPAIISVIALVLFAGCAARGLPVLMIAALAIWIGFMTTTYLAGNLTQLTGGLFGLGNNITQGVSGRVAGSTEHHLIAELRIAISGGIWLLALTGFVRRLRAGRADAAMAALGLAAFLLPALQPYGGEIFLRVFLFALPGTAFFIALAAFPSRRTGRRWAMVTGLTLVGCVLLFGFQYARYGNERMDNFSPSDVAAVRSLYRLAPRGSTLIAGDSNVPWLFAHYYGYTYLDLDDLPVWENAVRPRPARLVAEVRNGLRAKGGYVIFTRSMEIGAELFYGLPDLLPRFKALLLASPGTSVLYHHDQAEILHVAPIAADR